MVRRTEEVIQRREKAVRRRELVLWGHRKYYMELAERQIQKGDVQMGV